MILYKNKQTGRIEERSEPSTELDNHVRWERMAEEPVKPTPRKYSKSADKVAKEED